MSLASVLGVLLVVIVEILWWDVLLWLLPSPPVLSSRTGGLCLILLLGPTVSVPGGPVRLLSLFGVRLFGLLFGCLVWIEVGAPSLLRCRGLGDL